MAPKPDITVTMDGQLIDDLEELADRSRTDRSAEISTAAMIWVNNAIEQGHLDRPYQWDPAEHHADARSLV
jgi:metal-responsive CopG/Arc/MetJ family transcriptional regulator